MPASTIVGTYVTYVFINNAKVADGLGIAMSVYQGTDQTTGEYP